MKQKAAQEKKIKSSDPLVHISLTNMARKKQSEKKKHIKKNASTLNMHAHKQRGGVGGKAKSR